MLKDACTVVGLLTAVSVELFGATLEVGPGRRYQKIEAAYDAASPGDVILVYPLPDGEPYRRVALNVRKPRITFRAVHTSGKNRVRIDGSGFEYSGAGAIPRAIFQFYRGADGCVLEGFELYGARNRTHNGAGVRVHDASWVTIRDCSIHDNDMGIMTSGTGALDSAVGLLIERCVIYRNGSRERLGYSHNLYLGGTSVVVRGCEVRQSTAGHNVKSRAHVTWVEACFVHDAANREFDLVDSRHYTTRPGSHAVLFGNVIVKRSKLRDNRTVIHFGQDGGHDHMGQLFLLHNTIVTPYISPVVDLSAPGSGLFMVNSVVWDGGAGQRNMTVVRARDGARRAGNVVIRSNWFVAGAAGWLRRWRALEENYVGGSVPGPGFRSPVTGDFRLVPRSPLVNKGLPWRTIPWPSFPGDRLVYGRGGRPLSARTRYQYMPSASYEPRRLRDRPDLGAFELP